MRSIDDLPDDLLQACLARLSLRSMARLKTVCHRWNLALSDPSLMFHLRSSMGLTQPWAFAVHSNYNHVGSYDGIQISAVEIPPRSLAPLRGTSDNDNDDDDSSGIRPSPPSPSPSPSPSPWTGHGHGHGHVGMDPPLPPPHRIAVLKGPPRLQYAAAAGADGRRLYILGGRTPLMSVSPDDWLVFNRVDAYDPVTRLWYQTKPMLSPRYAFAVASFTYPPKSREACNSAMVIVAGGYDSSGMPLHSAEVYDAQLDRWENIPPMTRVSGACKGHFARGRFFYVFMANNGPDAFEAYDVASRCWISVADGHDKHVLVHPPQSSSSSSSFTNPCTIVLNL